jgi:radical SAM superfamily enzyme YgiQ (UPF0313 family)
MKIKLIIPRWPKNSFWDVITFKFPLLSTSLLAGLTPPEHQVSIVDESLTSIDFTEDVDLVGITAMTPLAPRAYEIGEEFRQRGVPVIIGGIHPTWLPEEAKVHCDSVVIGEADEIWGDILEDVQKNRLEPFYKQERRTDLSRLPLPRRDLLDKKGYFFENLIQTTRGCPYDCEFCSVTAMYGGSYRTTPIERIEEEIDALERSRAYIFFVDDNLIGNVHYARDLLTMLSHHRLRWVSQGPMSIARDPELVHLMAKAGCHGMFIGFESLTHENLRAMGKRMNRIEEYEDGIRRLHEHGIGIYASFVFGYDYDEPHVFDQFLDFSERNHIEGAFLPVLTPFPGTRVYRRLKEERRILTEDWSQYDMATVVFTPRRMTVDQLQEGFWKVNRGFYSIPSMVKRIFNPFGLRRSIIIFGPMNIGLWPAVKKAYRHFKNQQYDEGLQGS